MATTDKTDRDSSCPCGKGTIRVVQETPDHPYAKESQTSYTAYLKCDECAKTYCIVDDAFASGPYLGVKTEVEARDNARAEFFIMSRKFAEHPLAKSIQPAIIAEVDTARLKSKAEAWRVLNKYKLTTDSQATFTKRPKTGAEALKQASGEKLAKIGETAGETEQDRAAFANVSAKLAELHSAGYGKLQRIKTGHPWLEA